MHTDNYLQKYLVKKIFGQKYYGYIKLFKIIAKFKLGFEYEISKLLPNLLKHDDIAIDVGANIGHYAIRLSNILKTGKVYCIEPVKNNIKLMNYLKSYLNLKNLLIFNYAVSNINLNKQKIYIPIMAGDIEVDTQATIQLNNSCEKFREEEVDIITLDKFVSMQNINRIDFIKIDTEGNDDKVIDGAAKLIKSNLPLIVVEAIDKNSWLFKLDYFAFYKFGKKLIPYSKDIVNLKNICLDSIILIHRDKLFKYDNIIIK